MEEATDNKKKVGRLAYKTTCKSGSGTKEFKSKAAAERANHHKKILKIQKKQEVS